MPRPYPPWPSNHSPPSLTIHADQPGPQVNRQLFGQFAEHLGAGIYGGIWVGEDSKIPNTRGYRNDVLQALRDLKVPVIRWPGGCFADEYNWREGVGPRSKRPVKINTHWGGVTEPNTFGTHEFLDFAELIGAEAYISGNVGSAAPARTGGVGGVRDLAGRIAGLRARRQRAQGALETALHRARQRTLGLRRQHARRICRRRDAPLLHLHQGAGGRQDPEVRLRSLR